MQEGWQAAATSSLSSRQPAISSLLHQLEVMACTEASVTIPTSLQPVVQHTLDCISRSYQQPPDLLLDPHQPLHPGTHPPAGPGSEDLVGSEEEPVMLDEAWQCLAELLCEEDRWAAGVGEAWLYRLLTHAAEQRMAHPQQHEQRQDAHSQQQGKQHSDGDQYNYPASPGSSPLRQAGQIGLLPHPLGGPPKPDAPSHLTNQPELSQLLRAVLSFSSDTTRTGLVFVGVVKRLLLHLKLRCSLGPAEQHQHQAGVPEAGESASSEQGIASRGEASGRDRDGRSASAEDLLGSTAEAGMPDVHGATPGQASSALPSTAGADSDKIIDMPPHPHLMRTSPALSWGKPPHQSRNASDAQRSALKLDDGEEQRAAGGGGSEVDQPGMSHHRTQSGGLFHTSLSTAGSVTAVGGEGDDGPGQGAGAGPSGAASRALSSMLSTAELSGFFQEGDSKQEGAAVTHEGIVLHDAPLLGRNSPEQPAGM